MDSAMKLTKLEHAALILELHGQKLFIDPGSFTDPVLDPVSAAAIVITHEHADHWTPAQLNRILALNPGIPIYGPAGVVAAAAKTGHLVTEVADVVTPDNGADWQVRFQMQFMFPK